MTSDESAFLTFFKVAIFIEKHLGNLQRGDERPHPHGHPPQQHPQQRPPEVQILLFEQPERNPQEEQEQQHHRGRGDEDYTI